MAAAFSRRRIAIAGASAGALAIVLGAWAVLRAPYHFREVEPGVLYRSGTLDPGELQSVIADYGIKTVVNLRSTRENQESWHADEARVCEENGARLVDLPMTEETPPTAEQLDRWLALLGDPSARPILVHCKHGVVRTGMMVAAYEIERGGENRTVWDALPMFGHDREGGKRDRMRDFILHYVPRDRSVASE